MSQNSIKQFVFMRPTVKSVGLDFYYLIEDVREQGKMMPF